MKYNSHITEDKADELFPEVDCEGNVTGKMTRSEAHCGTKRLHPVVHLHVFDNEGRLYMQQRADWKEVQPGKWDTAVGGHIDYGETPADALPRESYEELGLMPEYYAEPPRLVTTYVYESDIERELVYIFRVNVNPDAKLSPSSTETKGGRFWTHEEILANIGKNVFTPMFEQEYQRYYEKLNAN